MRILVLGGDGYLGWPTALHLPGVATRSASSTTSPAASTTTRWGSTASSPSASCSSGSGSWEEVSGLRLETYVGDLTDADFVHRVVTEFEPEPIVHFAEQRSAPYSMIDREPRGLHPGEQRGRARSTCSTPSPTRPVHPPGQARHDGRVRHAQHRHRRGVHRDHPPGPDRRRCRTPSSPAPSTTCPRCTTATTSCSPAGSGACAPPTSTRASSTARRRPRPSLHPDLATRFDYDGVFGTVLNRFCVQAVVGPPADRLRQRRPDPGHARHPRHAGLRRAGLREPGRSRASSGSSTSSPSPSPSSSWPRWWPTPTRAGSTSTHLDNPRVEKEEHYYRAAHTKLLDLGLVPHLLDRSTISSLLAVADRHRDRVDPAAIRADGAVAHHGQ